MKKLLARLEAALGVLFFIGMFGAITIQVFFRYVLGRPLVWPFELSIYCFIYITYIGAAIAARKGSHVAFDLIHSRFPPRARRVTTIATNLFIIGIILYVMPSAFEYMRFIGDVRSSALQIPWAVIIASFPLGMGLIALHLAVQVVEQVKSLWAKEAL